MNAHKPIPAAAPLGSGTGAVSPLLAAPAFSLTKLLEDARRFERDPSNEGELSYLCNIFENLLRALPGIYAEEVLRDALSSAELALENECEDRRWNNSNRIEM